MLRLPILNPQMQKKNKIFWASALNTTSETYSSPLGPTTGGVGRGAAVLDPLITD